MSIREQILNANDIETQMVEVEQWGVTVEVRSLDGRSRAALIQAATNAEGSVDLEKLYPELVMLCAHDPATGERIFTPEDRDALMAKSGAALEVVALAAMQVSGMTQTARDEAGKDSSSIPNVDSSLS